MCLKPTVRILLLSAVSGEARVQRSLASKKAAADLMQRERKKIIGWRLQEGLSWWIALAGRVTETTRPKLMDENGLGCVDERSRGRAARIRRWLQGVAGSWNCRCVARGGSSCSTDLSLDLPERASGLPTGRGLRLDRAPKIEIVGPKWASLNSIHDAADRKGLRNFSHRARDGAW